MADEIKTPGAEEEYQPDLMTLEDEDGNEVTFEVTRWTIRACITWPLWNTPRTRMM